jgi:LPXTG-site transpeptidase (sortase) family protein
MTALETPTTEPDAPAERNDKPARSQSEMRAVPRRVATIAAAGLVAVFAAYALFQLFEGPIADAWYSNRQHQLAPQAATLQAQPHPGAPAAIMQIPRLGLDVVVAEGDSPQQLRNGPGHRVGTPMPGQIGNSVVSVHRTGWGGPMHDISQLKPGDHIVMQVGGPPPDYIPVIGVFEITSIKPASAGDVTVFSRTTDRRVTLLTGTGGQFSDRRLVVTAISGPPGKVLAPPDGMAATTGAGSLIWNSAVLVTIVCLGGAALIFFALRRRYHAATIAVVVAPLIALGLLGLLLDIDAALPPLR